MQLHDPDVPLLPLAFYVTDGSFTINTGSYLDILQSEHSLRQTGTGAAGIVLQPSDFQRSEYPHTVRIITRVPQPGMSAYAWELVAQVIALKLTQYYPSTLQGYSDCTATIARMNTAMSSFTNQLSSTSAGILSSAAHSHTSLTTPRRIKHVKAHPERDPQRLADTTPLDKAIFLADAIAGSTTTKLGKAHINHIPYTLVLEDILPELLPLNEWHLRQTDNASIPVLDLPWMYQHEAQLTAYLHDRDAYSTQPSDYWSSTSIDFAASVHPLPPAHQKSYWHAARRALQLFDWTGHGRNQLKRCKRMPTAVHPVTATDLAPCSYCGKHDDQEHIMLVCTHPDLTPIRTQAKRTQFSIASQLRRKYRAPIERYFINQFTYAS